MRYSVVACVLLYIFSSRVFAAGTFGFIGVNASNAKEKIEITDMPPVSSQDSLGICYAHAAAILLDVETCRWKAGRCKSGQKGDCIKSCSDLSDEDRFSPLGLANYATAKDDDDGNPYPVSSFTKGGNPTNVLQIVSILQSSGPNEACMSLDKILTKIGGAKQGATESQLAEFTKLQKRYEKYQKLQKKCGDCANEFYMTARDETNEAFNLQKTNEEILRAFSQGSYEEFIEQLLNPKECYRASNRVYVEDGEKLKVGQLPRANSKEKATYKESIAAIKKVLADKRPLAIGGLCLEINPPKNFSDCKNAHSLVINGYANICDSNGKNCRDAIRIQNSWGKGWQDSLKYQTASGELKSSDSWIDAKELLDKSTYSDAFLTWFEDKPKESI